MDGSTKVERYGGYSFDVSWKYVLPGVYSSGLCLYNFKTGPLSFLNNEAELIGVNTTGGTVNLSPKTPNAGIVYIAFSVVIVTQDVSYLELLSVT